MLSKNVLVVPCATQIGVEQFHSLKFNKNFNLIGAAHNESDSLYMNYIQLKHSIETPEFVEEILHIVKNNNIDVILPSHDEALYILKNHTELEYLIPGNSKEIVNICRFKSRTYTKLKTSTKLLSRIPQYTIINSGFLKPDRGQGSRGSLNIDQNYLHCEYLSGREYTIDCFSNSENELIYTSPRLRKTITNGISETTSIVLSNELKSIARQVNKVFKFEGPWFFQMKEDSWGNLKFLEIAPRIGGASNINRLNGINLTLSSLYQHFKFDIEILNQNLVTQVNRKQPKFNLNYETLFVDYDDTFKHIEKTLLEINKPVIVITRSKVKINTIYPTIYVKDNELKSDIINSLKKSSPIFVDDSFKERKDVILNCNIPSITPEEINYLI
jgi:hypothetical protein|tara:strand:- start:163 stop:1320 length:1158 start_codon:yes stop_codon:yes gene_type:complete